MPRMQLIRAVRLDAERYVAEEYHRQIEAPPRCPNCEKPDSLWALGYYARSLSRWQSGHLRLWIRRFRCRACLKTTSILPAFAQPYRFVQSNTIERFAKGGPWTNDVIRYLPLLQNYWKQYLAWLPELIEILGGDIPRPPPPVDEAEWWGFLLNRHKGLEATTLKLVSH